MKILVTGANGYIGQGVVRQLLKDKVEVIAADLKLGRVAQGAVLKETDIFALEDPYSFLGEPEILLHLAWRDGFKHDSINHINDLPLHYAFLHKMAEAGVKRMCVMGSMHEVGFYEGSINENTPTRPQSLYGISKDALRNMVRLLCEEHGICFQWIRGFYIVGNVMQGCSVFSKIAMAVAEGKKTFPFTQGKNQFDFLDYDRFCEQVAAVVEQDRIKGVINCCSGQPMKLSERVERFIKENGYEISLEYGAFPDRPYDSKAIWGNDEKISNIMMEWEKRNNRNEVENL